MLVVLPADGRLHQPPFFFGLSTYSTAGPQFLRPMQKASAYSAAYIGTKAAMMAMTSPISLGSTVARVARAVLPPLLRPEWLLLLVEDWVTGVADVAGLAAAAWRISLISCSSLPHLKTILQGRSLERLCRSSPVGISWPGSVSLERAMAIENAEVLALNAATISSPKASCDTCCASCRHSTQRRQVDLDAQVMLLCGDQQADIKVS